MPHYWESDNIDEKVSHYGIGQELIFICETRYIDNDAIWTKYKKYKIYSINGRWKKCTIIRDDGSYGLWWEDEIHECFITLKEYRKQKLKKLNEV